jgi:hypothetical protein
MVQLQIRKDPKGTLFRTNTMIAVAIVVVFLIFVNSNQQASNNSTTMESYLLRASSSAIAVVDSSSMGEGLAMKEWRDSSKKECGELIETITKFDTTALDKKENLERTFVEKLILNSEPSSTVSASKDQPYRQCRNAFIDLGTNIGDSVGYFIDNAIDICSPMFAAANPSKRRMDSTFPRPHIDVTTLEFNHRGSKPNPLFGILQRNTEESPTTMTENFW